MVDSFVFYAVKDEESEGRVMANRNKDRICVNCLKDEGDVNDDKTTIFTLLSGRCRECQKILVKNRVANRYRKQPNRERKSRGQDTW